MLWNSYLLVWCELVTSEEHFFYVLHRLIKINFMLPRGFDVDNFLSSGVQKVTDRSFDACSHLCLANRRTSMKGEKGGSAEITSDICADIRGPGAKDNNW